MRVPLTYVAEGLLESRSIQVFRQRLTCRVFASQIARPGGCGVGDLDDVVDRDAVGVAVADKDPRRALAPTTPGRLP